MTKPERNPGRGALSRYLRGLGEGRRIAHLAERSGVPFGKLVSLRDNPDERIKFLDAFQLCRNSGGSLQMSHFKDRYIPDRGRYETPLGRKIALALADGTKLAEVLQENAISHIEFKRWLEENTKWSPATRHRIRSAFSRNGIEINDLDFDEQVVNRLKARYLAALEIFNRRADQILEATG